MATLLMTAHNLISSCCGPAGNIFAKVFNNDDPEDQQQQQQATPAAATAAAPTAGFGKKKFGFTDKQAKYEDVTWSKLPLSARKAAKVIGFEQKTWDEKEWLHIDDKHWHDLTPEEKTAVQTLGWCEQSWDHKYEHTSWDDMPKEVQKAAEKLGWNKEKWDDDWDVETWDKGWEQFTDEEKRCLHVLGYYVHTWD